jgi:hypothetical protein
LIEANANEKVIANLNKGTISIGSALASIKNQKEEIKPKNIVKLKPERVETVKIDNITILQNIEEGKQKLLNGDIDVIMIFNENDNLDILKKNPNIKIGVFYLSENNL